MEAGHPVATGLRAAVVRSATGTPSRHARRGRGIVRSPVRWCGNAAGTDEGVRPGQRSPHRLARDHPMRSTVPRTPGVGPRAVQPEHLAAVIDAEKLVDQHLVRVGVGRVRGDHSWPFRVGLDQVVWSRSSASWGLPVSSEAVRWSEAQRAPTRSTNVVGSASGSAIGGLSPSRGHEPASGPGPSCRELRESVCSVA